MHEPLDECICHSCALHGRTVLARRVHDAYEVYAGMEGVKPVTALERYLVRVIKEMAKELKP